MIDLEGTRAKKGRGPGRSGKRKKRRKPRQPERLSKLAEQKRLREVAEMPRTSGPRVDAFIGVAKKPRKNATPGFNVRDEFGEDK